jgi:hypothetical protein
MSDSDSFSTITAALEQIQQALDRFEADSALLEPMLIPSLLALITETAARLREGVERHSSVNAQAFSRLLPDWLNAWRSSRAKMNELCAQQLGQRLPARSSVKVANWWKRRLLAQFLQTKDPVTIRELLEAIHVGEKSTGSASLVKAPEVNAALKTWGQMTFEEFLAAFPEYSKSLIGEACKQRGLKGKSATKAEQKRLHEEAKRFYQNTELG